MSGSIGVSDTEVLVSRVEKMQGGCPNITETQQLTSWCPELTKLDNALQEMVMILTMTSLLGKKASICRITHSW